MSLLRDQSLLISGGGVGGFLADHKFSWETEEGAIVSNEIQKGHSRELTTNGGGGEFIRILRTLLRVSGY